MIWAIVGLVVVVCIGVAVWFMRRREKPLVSIVLLRRATAKISESTVRGVARRIFGPEIHVMTAPSPDPGKCEAFVLSLEGEPGFFIISAARPYVDDVEEGASGFEDPRAREAFASHTAWIAIDIVGDPPRDLRPQLIRFQAKLAAEFLDDECLMLFAPAISRFALPSQELAERLNSDDPLAVFGDDEVNTPIISVDSDDRKVERAIREAQKNWPTFVEIWNRGVPDSPALVKGRFPAGEGSEYMWIEVRELTATDIAGELANEPAHVQGLRKGSHVRLAHADIVDWLCMDGDTPRGGYVERVLRGG